MITTKWRVSPDIHPLDQVRVIDGDTIDAQILLPFQQRVQKRIRLRGWWADELEGQFAREGAMAKARLETWQAGKALWLHSPSCRLDKYGRVVGHIIHENRIVTALEILGDLQLDEATHKRHTDLNRLRAKLGAP